MKMQFCLEVHVCDCTWLMNEKTWLDCDRKEKIKEKKMKPYIVLLC